MDGFVNNNLEPVYKQLAEIFENMIFSGAMQPGEKLPSENEMCKIYNVSRITVRQALNILTQKDLIYPVQGKGYFVKIAEIRQDLSTVVKFSEVVLGGGRSAFTRVESFNAGKHIARATEALGTDDYFNLFLLGHIHSVPVVYYKSYIRNEYLDVVYPMAKKLEMQHMPYSTLDIYDNLGIVIKTIKQNVQAINGNGKSGDILRIQGNQAILRLESIYYLQDDTPIEYKTAYYRSDVYSFELKRDLVNVR